MNNILVPTDFSTSAWHASDWAVHLAEVSRSALHFYTQIDVHPLWDELPERSSTAFPESYARISSTQKAFQRLQKRYQGRVSELRTAYGHGDFSSELRQYTKQVGIDLIVIGSGAPREGTEFLFGGKARKVVKAASCPVVIVKQPISTWSLDHIIFASDFQEGACEAFQRLCHMTEYANSHIHILPISPPSAITDSATDYPVVIPDCMLRDAAKRSYTVHEPITLTSEATLRAFVEYCEASMIALCYGNRSQLSNIFFNTLTEALVDQLDIPIMALSDVRNPLPPSLFA